MGRLISASSTVVRNKTHTASTLQSSFSFRCDTTQQSDDVPANLEGHMRHQSCHSRHAMHDTTRQRGQPQVCADDGSFNLSKSKLATAAASNTKRSHSHLTSMVVMDNVIATTTSIGVVPMLIS